MKIGAVVLMAFLFAACSKSSSNSNPVTPPSGNSNVSFSSQVQPIFTANCAVSGCHAGPTPQQGQDLSAGHAYNNIVNVASAEKPSYMRVKPFSSDSSYLYLKITGAAGIAGVQMPNGRPPLSSSDIQTIKEWIDQGAQNN